MVIRPPRNQYPDDTSSNNQVVKINDKSFVKKVFTIKNKTQNTLHCSFFEPVESERPSPQMPCVVYMHGNAGNKLEGEYYKNLVLPHGINLFCFDFSGCGNSEGEWVTLGWKEKDDLDVVIEYLKKLGTVSKIGLWGRSMGAATSIMYIAEHPDVASAAVLDSSYSTF